MLNSLLLSICVIFCNHASVLPEQPAVISSFSLPDIISGQEFSIDSYQSSKAVVVIFTSASCPYVKQYHKRVVDLIQQYSNKGVKFVLINSNDPTKSTTDTRNGLEKSAKNLGYKAPYLIDTNQKVADMFGAHKTPEVFLLRPTNNNQFQVVYKGAIDDNPQVASDVDQRFLQNAIDAHLAGNTSAKSFVHPTGCMIKR